MKKKFSIVIPIYKSELNIPVTVPYIMGKIPELFPNYEVELILVNDGSPDGSWELMTRYQKEYPDTIRIESFTRNFGQVMAIRHGISIANGDFIGVIAADLQDPFELFVEMLLEAEKGNDLVCGVRSDRNEKGLGVLCSKVTHFMVNHFITSEYPNGGFDFFVLTKRVAERYLQLGEHNGSFQLMLLWASNSVAYIPYTRNAREVGSSSWTFSKKIKYFIDTFVSNTFLPLRVMSVTGFLFAAFAFAFSIIVFVSAFLFTREVPGWSSLALLITFFSGLILASLGVIGEYLWRIFDEVRNRPLYFVKDIDQESTQNL